MWGGLRRSLSNANVLYSTILLSYIVSVWQVETMVKGFGTQSYIANLGHGMHPDHKPEHAGAFIEVRHTASLLGVLSRWTLLLVFVSRMGVVIERMRRASGECHVDVYTYVRKCLRYSSEVQTLTLRCGDVYEQAVQRLSAVDNVEGKQ